MMPISGQEGKLIVDKFAHSNDKLKAVEVIAKYVIITSYSSSWHLLDL